MSVARNDENVLFAEVVLFAVGIAVIKPLDTPTAIAFKAA